MNKNFEKRLTVCRKGTIIQIYIRICILIGKDIKMREKLKAVRKINRLTQADVAKNIEISRTFYTRLELGTRDPSIKTAKKLEILFETPMEELFPDIFSNLDQDIEREEEGSRIKRTVKEDKH